MKKKLLCFALVLAMAVAVFDPGVSALAEGAGSVRVMLIHDDVDGISYGESLYYSIEFMDGDGRYIYIYDEAYEEYLKAHCTLELLDRNGVAVRKNDDWSTIEEFYRWGEPYLYFTGDAAKAWEEGRYTLSLTVTVGDEVLHDEFDFWYYGWNGAEPEVITLEVDESYGPDGMGFGVYAYVTNAEDEPVQSCDLIYSFFDADGEVMYEEEVTTSSYGRVSRWLWLSDGANAYGIYMVKVSAKNSAGNAVSAVAPLDFHAKNKPQVITVETPIKSVYYYGQYLELEISITDKAGNPAQAAWINARILNADGTELRSQSYVGNDEGFAWIDMGFYEEDLPAGDYVLQISTDEAELKLPFAYLGKVKPYAITLVNDSAVRDVYYYGEGETLRFAVTGENGEPVAHERVFFEILHADGTPADVPFIWGYQTEYYNRTDSDGVVPVGLYFDDLDRPAGDYILRVTVGDLAPVTVPFSYRGKIVPEVITAGEGVKDTYHYGEDILLYFKVTNKDGVPVRYEGAYFEILNADGSPSNAGIIWYRNTETYAWIDDDGIACVNFYAPDEETVPEGDYLLQVSVGDFSAQFPFRVEKGSVTLFVEPHDRIYGSINSSYCYNQEMELELRISYPGGYTEGIDEAFAYADFHWWIVNSAGETVFDVDKDYKNGWSHGRFHATYWFMLAFKDWESGTYTVVAEVTANDVTMHGETTFEYIAWNGSGDAEKLSIGLNGTTFNPNDKLDATVSVVDENGIPVQGDWYVRAYLRYENGAPTYVRWGYEQTFLSNWLDGAGTGTLSTWFDEWAFDSKLAAGTYVLVFECGGLKDEKPIYFTGFKGAEATGPKEVPTLTVTPDKFIYTPDDVMHLDFVFSGASAETIAAYEALTYIEIYASNGNDGCGFNRDSLDQNGNFSLENFVEWGMAFGSYTFHVTTYPGSYGWLAAEYEFTIFYSPDGTGPKEIELLTDLQDVYSYGSSINLWVKVTDENGDPVRNAKVTMEVLDAAGNLLDADLLGGAPVCNRWTYSDGEANVYMYFDNADALPSGNYQLRFSVGEVSKIVPFAYVGKVEPKAITLSSNVPSTYYYGDEIDLLFYVTGEGDLPAKRVLVDFALLDAAGNIMASNSNRTSDYGAAWAYFDSLLKTLPAGTYTLVVSSGDISTTVQIVYAGKVVTKNIRPDDNETVYYAEQDVYLRFHLTGANGEAAHDDVLFEILNADGSPSNVGLIWYGRTSASAYTNDSGWVSVNLYFNSETTPEGEYLLRVSSGDASITVKIVYAGKVAPAKITARSYIYSTYYYGQNVSLSFYVTGENGVPVVNESVFFEILNADGTPSDVCVISGELSSDYGWVSNGYTSVDLYFGDAERIPEGNYILRVTVGDATAEFPFAVAHAEPKITLTVYNERTDDNSQFRYGDWLDIVVGFTYPNGAYSNVDEIFNKAPLHWWIEDGSGKVVFEDTVDYYSHQKWAYLEFDQADWADGTYTVVVEVACESGTYRAEHSFYYTKAEEPEESCKHKNTTTKTEAATCTKAGYEDVVCSDCGEVISHKEIPALGHDFKDGVCTRCGEKDPDYKDPKPAGLIGDVNFDGKVNSTDYMMLKRHILGTRTLSEEALKVADVDYDGKVTSTDYIKLKRYILETYEIKDPNA